MHRPTTPSFQRPCAQCRRAIPSGLPGTRMGKPGGRRVVRSDRGGGNLGAPRRQVSRRHGFPRTLRSSRVALRSRQRVSRRERGGRQAGAGAGPDSHWDCTPCEIRLGGSQNLPAVVVRRPLVGRNRIRRRTGSRLAASRARQLVSPGETRRLILAVRVRTPLRVRCKRSPPIPGRSPTASISAIP